MAIDLTKYYRSDIINVKDAEVGGRLFSAVFNADLPNGILGGLGSGFVHGSTEIKQFILPTVTTAKTLVPVIIQVPEIIYDETTRANLRLGIFRNLANTPFATIPLQNFDEIALSEAYLTKTGTIAVGDVFVLNTDGLLSYADGTTINATDYKTTFVVTEINNSHVPNYVAGDGTFAPSIYKLYDLEINVK